MARGKKVMQGADGARVKPGSGKAKVLILDDHPVLRDGVQQLLDRQADMVTCGSVGTPVEAYPIIDSQHPDLLLLDLRLGKSDGLETIKNFKALYPDLRILILSQLDETLYAERALRAGALGYVMKEQATEELLNAVRTVLSDQVYVSHNVSHMALQRMIQHKPSANAGTDLGCLSDRELQVYGMVGEGHSNKEIAAALKLSVKTVETYREHIKYKLSLSSGEELVRHARHAAQMGGLPRPASSTPPPAAP